MKYSRGGCELLSLLSKSASHIVDKTACNDSEFFLHFQHRVSIAIMKSLFLYSLLTKVLQLSPCREVIIEKHWRGVTSRAVCDFFWDEVNKYDTKEVTKQCRGYLLIDLHAR